MVRKRMRLLLAGGMCFIAVILAGFAIFDIVEDFASRGDPLWSTILESLVPIVLNIGVMYAGYRLYHDDTYADHLVPIVKWFGGTLLAMGLIMVWVVGFESVQTRYDPIMIVTNSISMGAIAGIGIGLYDVRQRRRATEVTAERDRVSALFENSTDAVARIELTESGVSVGEVNERFEEVFGYDLEALRTEGMEELLTGEDTEATPIRTLVQQGERTEQEVRRHTAHGEREFILRTIPIGSATADRHELFAVYTDITERKQREQQLEEYKNDLENAVRKLERSNEELEQFAYIASHDLQEPLRMVSSYMDLVESEYADELDDEGREYIEFATDGATRMQKMIDDLLTFSRVGERNLDREHVDADEILDDVLQNLQVQIAETDATVTRGELPELDADRSQLARVFQNLIANALNYSGDDPAHVDIGVEERSEKRVFFVRDQGIGIPEDEQDRIFDIFTRGERNDADDGTGIGLTLCRRIVQAHDGEMWVESEVGEGTTFYFTIP